MKHIILTILLAVCSIVASAQVPKFFGVPVNGSPDMFVTQLRQNGLKLKKMVSTMDAYNVENFDGFASITILSKNNLVYQVWIDETMSPNLEYVPVDKSSLYYKEHKLKYLEQFNADVINGVHYDIKTEKTKEKETIAKLSSSSFYLLEFDDVKACYTVVNKTNKRKLGLR